MTARRTSRLLPDEAFISAPGQVHPRKQRRAQGLPDDEVVAPFDPSGLSGHQAFLYALDLFDHGFYWEAHEQWEALWHALGRRGEAAELLKGLIKLAAAGVKVRQGMPEGVRSHGERAAAHFRSVNEEALAAFADDVASRAAAWPRHQGARVAVVFDRPLPAPPSA